MAQAVKELFPLPICAKFQSDQLLDKGFYYDFELENSISESELEKKLKKMKELANAKPRNCTERSFCKNKQ